MQLSADHPRDDASRTVRTDGAQAGDAPSPNVTASLETVTTRAVADNLADIGATVLWADDVMAAAGVEADVRAHVQVCIEEHLANLLTHAPASGNAHIELTIHVTPEVADVTVSDQCAPFDPTSGPLPAWSVERLSGNGLRLIRGFASELRYTTGEVGNAFVMSFVRPFAVTEALRTIPAFARLPATALARLAAAAKPREGAAGETLMRQGEPSGFALALLEGALAVIDESAHGVTTVGGVTAPALVGEIGALAGLPRTATLVANGPVVALEIPSDALIAAAQADPALLTEVVATLGSRVQTLNHAIGLYARGLEALERNELDLEILEELTHPSVELAALGRAFAQLARRLAAERAARGETPSA